MDKKIESHIQSRRVNPEQEKAATVGKYKIVVAGMKNSPLVALVAAISLAIAMAVGPTTHWKIKWKPTNVCTPMPGDSVSMKQFY